VKKIPTLFQRTDDRRFVRDEVTPGCEWVLNGEGVATRKYDGTCVSWQDGDWWFRREVKPGSEPPEGWVEEDHDAVTGKRVGWEPARPSSGFILMLRDAIDHTLTFGQDIPEGTYELCGPKINKNPEGYTTHVLIKHSDAEVLDDTPWTFDGLADWLSRSTFEGIVWHHPDGRMVKLKRRDFPKETR
jgi:hypothetical protein